MDKLPEKMEVISGLQMRIQEFFFYKTTKGESKLASVTTIP